MIQFWHVYRLNTLSSLSSSTVFLSSVVCDVRCWSDLESAVCLVSLVSVCFIRKRLASTISPAVMALAKFILKVVFFFSSPSVLRPLLSLSLSLSLSRSLSLSLVPTVTRQQAWSFMHMLRVRVIERCFSPILEQRAHNQAAFTSFVSCVIWMLFMNAERHVII